MQQSIVKALGASIKAIEATNEWVGRTTAWLTLGTVLVCFLVVVLRYVFHRGEIWLQELYIWQHAIVFMVGAGYTFLQGGHVRVDIFYAKMSILGQAWVNIFGTLFFLLPSLALIVYFGWDFVEVSWRIREPSSQAGGLPGFYLLKTVIIVFCTLIALQGLALLMRGVLVVAGHREFAPAEKHA